MSKSAIVIGSESSSTVTAGSCSTINGLSFSGTITNPNYIVADNSPVSSALSVIVAPPGRLKFKSGSMERTKSSSIIIFALSGAFSIKYSNSSPSSTSRNRDLST